MKTRLQEYIETLSSSERTIAETVAQIIVQEIENNEEIESIEDVSVYISESY